VRTRECGDGDEVLIYYVGRGMAGWTKAHSAMSSSSFNFRVEDDSAEDGRDMLLRAVSVLAVILYVEQQLALEPAQPRMRARTPLLQINETMRAAKI